MKILEDAALAFAARAEFGERARSPRGRERLEPLFEGSLDTFNKPKGKQKEKPR